MKPMSLTCPQCRHRDDYQIKWLKRTKKERLPPGADERERAMFRQAPRSSVSGRRHGELHALPPPVRNSLPPDDGVLVISFKPSSLQAFKPSSLQACTSALVHSRHDPPSHPTAVVGVRRAKETTEISLLERDRDDEIGRAERRERYPGAGHDRRRPDQDEPRQVDRMPDEPIKTGGVESSCCARIAGRKHLLHTASRSMPSWRAATSVTTPAASCRAKPATLHTPTRRHATPAIGCHHAQTPMNSRLAIQT